MISLSYHLALKEGKILGPERPLSDMGKVSYRSFWTDSILMCLKKLRGQVGGNVGINDISKMTGIMVDDIIETLKSLELVKYWNGLYHI